MSDLSPQGYIDQRTNHPFWGGGGGGTTNYNELENKPLINNVTLQGNLTLAQLGIPVYSVFSVGSNGLVPAPTAADSGKFLRADGTWQTVGGGGGGGGLTLDLESSWYSTIDVFSRIDRMVLDLSKGYGTSAGSQVSSIFGALLQGENTYGPQSLYLSFGPRIDLMGTIYHDNYDAGTHSTEPIAQYGITPREMRMIFNVDLYDTTEDDDHWVTASPRNVYFQMENPVDLTTYGEDSSVLYKLPLLRGWLYDEDNETWISSEYAGITNFKLGVSSLSEHPDGWWGRDLKYIQVGYDGADGGTGYTERVYLPGGSEPKTYYRGIINTATPMSISSLQTATLSVDLASNTNNAGEIGLQLGTTELMLSSYSPSVAYSTPRDLLLRKVQDVVYEDGISGFEAYIIDGVCETERGSGGSGEYEYSIPSSATDPEITLTPTSQQTFPIYYNEAVTSGGATAVMSRSVNLTNLKVSLVGATLYKITQLMSGMPVESYKILIPKNQSTTRTISSNPGAGKITTRLNAYLELTVASATIDATNPV